MSCFLIGAYPQCGSGVVGEDIVSIHHHRDVGHTNYISSDCNVFLKCAVQEGHPRVICCYLIYVIIIILYNSSFNILDIILTTCNMAQVAAAMNNVY